jgi:hypothetical protein
LDAVFKAAAIASALETFPTAALNDPRISSLKIFLDSVIFIMLKHGRCRLIALKDAPFKKNAEQRTAKESCL